MSVKYPQHEAFGMNREQLELLRDFLEWCIECKDFPSYLQARCKTLDELTDREKERLILTFVGLDVDAFYEEKEQMVRDLQEIAREREKA